MTPLSKISLATLILGSAFLTAKYLHTDPVELERSEPRLDAPRRPLSWQARSLHDSTSPGLTEVAQTKPLAPAEPLASTPVRKELPKPLEFDAQVSFAAFANSPPRSNAAEPAPPLPVLEPRAPATDSSRPGSAQGTTANDERSVLIANERRPPIPLAPARPHSNLSQVQRHETASASAEADFVEHTVQFGETLPQLASKYLGNREAYLSIYTANLDVLSNPADVTPGLVLKIPVNR